MALKFCVAVMVYFIAHSLWAASYTCSGSTVKNGFKKDAEAVLTSATPEIIQKVQVSVFEYDKDEQRPKDPSYFTKHASLTPSSNKKDKYRFYLEASAGRGGNSWIDLDKNFQSRKSFSARLQNDAFSDALNIGMICSLK